MNHILYKKLIILSLLLLLSLNINVKKTSAYISNTDGMVIYLNLNESSGTSASDGSGNNNTGSVINGASFGIGREGNAIELNGTNQYISVTNNSSIQLANTPYTISLWVKHNDPNSTSNSKGILSKFSGSGLFIGIVSGKPYILHSSASSSNITGKLTMTQGTWYHLTVVYDRSNLSLYVNGVLDSSKSISTDLSANTDPLKIGNFNGNYFLGSIDDVAIYNRALSSSEISSIFNEVGGSIPQPPPTDTTSPTISITSPTSGSTVSGSINITANASDNVGIAGVQFYDNGNVIGSEDISSPYDISWNTSSVSNGNHNITARARDLAGNTSNSGAVIVSVNNTVSPPPPPNGNSPSTITNLNAFNILSTGASITWNAPSDSNGQSVSSYDIRYSTGLINESNWSNATQVTGEPTGGIPSSPRLYTLSGLSVSTTYYVAIKSTDQSGNVSSLSNVISFTTTSSSGPVRTPLTDLGSNMYLGAFQGGLYENGTNSLPSDHASAGLSIASQVIPRNTGGTPDSSGKIVLLSIGMSNTAMEFCNLASGNTGCDSNSFIPLATSDSRVNQSTLTIVNGAMGSQDAAGWDNTTDTNYNRIRDNILTPMGLSEQQVQVAWVKLAQISPVISLPAPNADAYDLQLRLGNVVRVLKLRYPNLRQVFFSSRIYAGYTTGNLNPEPYAYETAFSPKWLIQAQINQMRNNGNVTDSRSGNLNYNNGTAPWIAWGPYLWADGTTARSDGLTWQRSDLISDGIHPSSSGIQKVANQLLNFFLNSPQTQWFKSSTNSSSSNDTTPPIISNGLPNGSIPSGTNQISISVSTNESSTCRYSTTSNISFNSMTNTFLTTGTTNHSNTISNLQNGSTYTYYVKCRDISGNSNLNDFLISFSVATAQTNPSNGNIWYVSPTGSPSGNGSITNPWNLQTALNHPSVVLPGHTIYLRGGVYNGPFRSLLNGNSSNRIVVKSYPGETAILDNPNNSALPGWGSGASPSLFVSGNYIRFERLEFTNSFPQKTWGAEWTVCYPNCRGAGVVDVGDGNYFIHNVIHNTGEGIESQGSAQNGSLYYGNVSYYIGWMSDGVNGVGRGHSFYTQNDCSERKTIQNNIDFWSFTTSQQIYGSGASSVRCVDSIGNVMFDSGRMAINGESGIIVGGNSGASDIKLIDNIVYQTVDCDVMPRSNALKPAYLITPSNYEIRNNYFKACKSISIPANTSFSNLSQSGNSWFGIVDDNGSAINSQFNGNTFGSYGADTTNRVIEKWSSYDSTWGYLVVMNNSNTSNINWTPTGCTSGQTVELRDIMNHKGSPVHTFNCDGSSKSINTSYSGSIIQPVGNNPVQPVHSGNKFRVFLLTKTSGGSNPTPTPVSTPPSTTPPTDTTSPTISITGPASGSTVSGSINITANASDNVGIVGVQFYDNGNAIGSEDISSPYDISWNTSSVSNGNHSITARARDLAGNTSNSYSIIVNVNNVASSSTATPSTTTATPSSVSISGSGSGSGGSSSGTGGGSIVSPPTTTTDVNQISLNPTGNVIKNTTTDEIFIPPNNVNIVRNNVYRKSKGDDVLNLQRFLSTSGYIPSENTTGYFGPLTESAVKKFQSDYGIVSSGSPNTTGYGVVGPKTREVINGLISEKTNLSPVNPSTNNISKRLQTKSIGQEVTILQNFLIKNGFLESNKATGYFGPLTESAVKKFQSDYGIVSSGSPNTTGYGVVGPKTREVINGLINQ